MDIKLYGTIYRATIRLRFVVTGRLVCCKTSRLFSVSIVTGPIQAKRCSRINTISPVLAVNVGQRSATTPPPPVFDNPSDAITFQFQSRTDRPNALFSYRSCRCVTTFDRVLRYRPCYTLTLMFALRFTTSLWQLDVPFDHVFAFPSLPYYSLSERALIDSAASCFVIFEIGWPIGLIN